MYYCEENSLDPNEKLIRSKLGYAKPLIVARVKVSDYSSPTEVTKACKNIVAALNLSYISVRIAGLSSDTIEDIFDVINKI